MSKIKKKTRKMRANPEDSKKFFWVLLVFVLVIGIWIGVQGANQGMLTLATSAKGLTNQDGSIKVRIRALDASKVNESLYTIDQTAVVKDGQLKLRWQIPGTAKKKAAYIEVCALDKRAGPSSTVKKACIEQSGDVAYNKVSCPYYVPANSTGFSGQLNGWNKLDDSQKVGCSGGESFGKVSSLKALATAQSPGIEIDGGGVLVANNGKIETKDVEQFVKDALSESGDSSVVQVTSNVPTPGPQGVAGVNGSDGIDGTNGADGAVGVATVSGGGLILTGSNLSLDDSCIGGQILQWDGSSWNCATVSGTDSQTLSLAANVLAISGGNSVNLASYLDNTDSQALSWVSGTRTLSLVGGGSVVISDADTTYTAGNGLSLAGTTFSINSPTCAGTTKLTWNGSAFSCAADVDTDTDTTYNAGTGLGLSGTTFNLANTAVTPGTYSASNNANGSLALPQFTVDAQGRLTAASTSNVTLTGIANSQLTNSAITVNTAGPLAGGGSVSLGGSLNLSLDLSDSGDSATATTSSGSGLEISGNEVGLLRGCSTGQLLKWNSSSLRWECATDTDTDTNSGGTVTGITAGTGLAGGTITTSGTINIANTGVSAATYGSSTSIPVITVNAQGQITAATSTAIPTANTSTTGLLTDTDWDTFNGKENVLTFNGNGLFSRSGNTVTGLACTAGQIPKWTAGTFACGSDDNSGGAGYSAGNGLSLSVSTFSINSPTCSGTDKLQWNGTAFSCATDVDTDTNTTDFNISANGGAGQNIAAGDTVNFANGTGTTASRSGNDISFGIANTAVSAGTYTPSNNANGSLALPQFTVDAQGRLTAASTTNVTLTGIANSQLTNSSITVNTAGGLTGGATVSLGGTLNLGLDLSDAGDSTTATTSSGSGLEVSGSEVGLIRGCSSNQLLKWNSTSLRWECATDTDTDTNSGGTVTSITAGTGLSGGTITTSGTIAINNTGVTAATYGSSTSVPVITVNAQGQITAASSSAIPTATTSTTGLLTDADWDTFNGKENVLTFNGNGLFSRSGNTVTGLACTTGQIPKWTAGAFACGADVDTDTDTTYSAGNGLSLGGTTFSINSPTCSGTDKLVWSGTAFSCATDVDTDTDTTNFNVAAAGTGGSQNISSGGTVTFGNGTGTTATRSGSTVTYGLNNTAVSAGTYAPSDNGNGSLALPQLTVDAQGRLTAASTTNVTLTGIANSQLANSAITVNTAGGLTGGTSVSLGGSINLSLDLSDAGDTTTATTNSGSGLEVSGGEIGLIRGCSSSQLLKWNSTSLRWECAADVDTDTNSGGTVTSITAGTGLSGGTITTSGTINIANTGVTAASYGSSTSIPVITVNAQGQITAASSSAIPTATTSTTGLLTDTDWDTFNGKENVLTFNGNGLFSRSGNTVTGLACTTGQIPKWTAGTFACGSDIDTDTDTTYSAGNGLSLGGTTFSINSPTCAGTDKLTWSGTAFSCASDVDTDTDTTNFNVAAAGTGGSQNISSGGTVTFGNGTGTTATRSGSTVTYGLNNTAVSAGTYTPSDNADGSLALPQLTVDAQGRLTAASTTNVTLTGIANSQLANSAITVNTAGGLTGSTSVSLGGSINLSLDLSDAGDSTTATTNSGSGLEVSGGEIGLIRGCSSNQLLKWNSTSLRWECATDVDTDTNSGGTVTSITAGTGLSGGTITNSGTISIANSGVTAASYGSSTSIPVITVNAQGQITAATSTAIPTADTSTTGLLTDTDWDTFNGKENVLTFNGNGLFSRSGNTVTGLACSAGEIPKWISGAFACGADSGGSSYTAGNGLTLTGASFSVNSPTCSGTDKLQWTGTAFICSADIDTDTGVTSIGTIDSQTKSANGAVISGTSLVLQTADGSSPGLVSTTTQTFAGAKTFSGSVNANGDVTLGDAAADGITITGEIRGASPLAFEGATNDGVYTTFAITDPTSARTITFPDRSGTVSLSGDTFTGDVTGTLNASGATALTIAANSVALGTDTTGDYVVGNTAGNGISVTGSAGEGWSPTISINAPTCSGTDKLSWNGTVFSCAADVDTDTDTTNFNVAAAGTGGSQNISSGGTVTFGNGTGTTATRSGSTVTYGLNNTAVSAGTYSPSDNANGSLALPQFTVDAQGRLTAASTTNVTLTGIANSQLTNSAITVNTAGGLSGGSSVSLGGSINLSLDLSDAGDTATATTNSGSGLEVSGGEIGLIRGCSSNQLLKWNSTSLRWECAADTDTNSGGTVTSIIAGTGLSGGTITTSGTIDIANTGVTAATYGSSTSIPVIAVNAQGQITSASSTAIPTSSTSTTGLLTDTDWDTFNGKENVLTFTGNGLFSRSGNTVTGLACSTGEIPKWTGGTFACGTDIDTDTDTTYSAGNGLSLGGTTFSINSPTCAGTDKLTWSGTAFSCAADVDTDTGVTSVGTIDSQTKSANGAVISGTSLVLQTADGSSPGLVSTGTQTFAGAKTFSGSVNANGDVTLGDAAADGITITGEIRGASPLAFEGATNDGVYTTFAITDPTTARTITFPDRSGTVSLSGDTFTGDVTGTLNSSGATTLTIAANSVALGTDTTGDYVSNVTAGGGLTGTATGEGSTPTLAIVSSNGGIVVNADDIALTIAASANGLSSTTSSGSGLEVLSSGLTLLQGCSNSQILKWNETTDVWECAADVDTDTGVTSIGTIDSQTKSANGAVISGTSLVLQTADASNPGLVSTGTQTFAGDKTFNGNVIADANLTANGDVTLGNAVADAITFTGEIRGASPLAFEGATNDGVYTTFAITDPTVARTVTFPDRSGTVSLSGDTFTGDVTGTLNSSGATTLTIAANSVALGTDTTGDYVSNVTAGGGLTGTATGEGSTPTLAIVSSNGGIVVNADDIALTIAASANALSSTTSSGSGLEILASGLTLLQGCSDGQLLKWNETTDVWSCSADIDTDTGVTSIGTIDSQTKSANGAVISGSVIYFQTADASNVGLVSTGTQTFAGNKTFNGNVIADANLTVNGDVTLGNAATDGLTFTGEVRGASPLAFEGVTNDGVYTTFAITDPTSARTITFPDRSGTVSLSGDTFTGDVTGTLNASGATTLTIAANSVALGADTTGDYVSNVTAGGGLTGTATGEGSTPTLAIVSSNGGIVVNADDIALTIVASANALSSTTSSGSGLEILASGVTLLQGCSDTQLLKWNETTDVWACAADTDTDTGVTSVGAIDSQTKSANGAVISGTVAYLQTADATAPGLVSTGTQTFAGDKTFNGNVVTGGNLSANGDVTLGNAATDAITFTGEIRGASPLAFEGATNDNVYTTFAITDPTGARTITFPDASGTVCLQSSSSCGFISTTLTNGQILIGNGSNVATAVTPSGDVTISNTGVTTIGANSVALGTDTTGDYVVGNTAGNGISVSGSTGEGWSPTISINAPTCAGTDKLTWNGSAFSCATDVDTDTGVTSVGTIDSQTKSANGAVISGTSLVLQTADGTSPGLVSTTTQTFAGDKTFSGNVNANGDVTLGDAAADGITINGEIRGASPLAFEGATNDGVYTTFAITDPTLARTITFPDRSGTVSLSGDTFTGDVTGTLNASGATALTIAANSVALGTDTTGNYVADVAAGTGLSVSGTPGEGWTPTVSLANTAVSAGAYAAADNANGSIAIPQFTVDAQGRLTAASTTNITPTGIANAQLANSSLTITAGAGLANGGAVSLGGTVALDIGAGNGITVNTNDITIDLTAATDALSATTSSSSGLEVLSTGLTLLQGCSDTQILKWDETTDVWGCSADIDTDTGVTTIGTLDSLTKSADGAVISGTSLVLQSADATYPGLVSTGTQTFAGNKTFSGNITGNGSSTFNGQTLVKGAYSNLFDVKNAANTSLLTVNSSSSTVSVGSSALFRVGSGSSNVLSADPTSNFLSGITDTINFVDTSSANVFSSYAWGGGLGDIYIGDTGYGITLNNTTTVLGDVDISGIYKSGGTPGVTTTCSGGQVLQNLVATGGIVTAGTCAADAGVTTIGTIDSQTKSANGAVISGTSLVMQNADASFPGLVSTGTQTFAGDKTFTGLVTANGNFTLQTGDTFTMNGDAFTDLTGSGLAISSGALIVDDTSATGFFRNGGNTFGAAGTLGTNDANVLNIETNNTNRFQIAGTSSTLTGQGTTNIASTGTLGVNSAAGFALNLGTTSTGSIITVGNTSSTTALNLSAGSGGIDLLSVNQVDVTANGNISLSTSGGNVAINSNDTTVYSQNDSALAFQVQNSLASPLFNVDASTASTTVYSPYDSTTAFQVQNSIAGLLFNVDASTGSTTIASGGAAGSTTNLQVLNGTGDQVMNVNTTNIVNNLITNPSFEVDDSGWTGSAYGIVDTTQSYIGKSSYVVNAQSVGGGATYDVALASDTSYTLSFYAKVGADEYRSNLTDMYAGYYDGTSNNNCIASQTVSSSGWTRYSCAFTTGTTSGTPNIYIRQNDSIQRNIYIDGVQLLDNTLPSNVITGTDSTFESGIGTWAGYSSGGITQSSTTAHMGTYSGRMITTGGGNENGISYGYSGFSPYTTYTIKAYIKADATSASATYQLGHVTDNGQVSTVSDGCNIVTPTSSTWKVLTCTFTTAISLRPNPYITITQKSNLSTSTTTYVDSISMYAGTDAYGTDQGFTMGRISLNGAIESPALFQNASNSTTAFQIQGANSSNALLVADTLNNRVAIGKNTASYTLDVEGIINASTSVITPSLTSLAATALSIDSGTTGALNIGTGANAKAITIGNGTGATSVEVNCGTGVCKFGTNATVHTTTLGSLTGASATVVQAGTGGLTLGSSGVANTIQLGNTTGAVSQTINIGNNATASSTSNVNIGSTVAGVTTINGTAIVTGRTTGSSSTLLVNNSTSTGAIFVAQDNGTAVLTIANNGGATFKTVTNTTNAFKTTNSNNDILLNVGTSQSIPDYVNILNNSSFESGSTGWASKSGGIVSSGSGGGSVTGISYMSVSMDAVDEGAYYSVTLSPNTDYTFSVYAKTSWGATNDLIIGHQDLFGSDVDDCVLSGDTIDTDWRRVSCSFTTGASISNSSIYIKQSDGTTRTVDYDAAQLQASPSLSAYNMGQVYFNAPINQNLIITANGYAGTNDLTFQVQDSAGALQFGISAGGAVTVSNGLAVNGGEITSTAGTFNFLQTDVTELNIGDAVGASGINLAGGSGSTGCTINGTVGSLTCSGNITSTATSGIQGWWSRTGTTLQPLNSGDNITTTGNISTTSSGNITSAGDLQVDGNTVLGNAASDAITFTGEVRGASPLVFEGSTNDGVYTTFAITDPTLARTVTFPDRSGTVSLSGDTFTGDVTGTLDASGATALTIAANSVALGTDTTGDYVAGNTAGNGIAITGSAGEGWSPTVSISAPTCAGTDKLQWNGTAFVCTADVDTDTGVTTVGAFSGSSIANGASISGSTITFGPADGTNPGMVTTGTQTLAGAKTFTSATTVKPTSNSATAFSVQDNTNANILTVSTSAGNKLVYVGEGGIDAKFQVINTSSTAVLDIDTAGGGYFAAAFDDFIVQNSVGGSMIYADGVNNRITFGDADDTSSANTSLLIVDSASTANLPTGVNGGIVYDSQVGKFKIYEGGAYKILCNTTDLSCGAGGSGVTTVGAFSGSSQTNGASISGSTITFGPADGTNPGMVTTGTQTFAGAKTFTGNIITNSALQVDGSTVLGDATTDTITAKGSLIANASATGTTATTSGTGTNTSTVTLTGSAFTNGDVILIDNAGQDYYTRVTAGGGTASLTVSPAVTFETARTVTKYNIQNIGATDSDYTTASNRFFQGYFLGGVVAGAGTTTLSDGSLASTVGMNFTSPSYTFKNTADSTSAFQVQTSGGTNVLGVDTTNKRVNIGSGGTPTSQLYVSGNLPTAATGTTQGISGSTAYSSAIQDNHLYVVDYNSWALEVYDVSNPSSPTYLNEVTTDANPTSIYVAGKYAYVTTLGGDSLQIFDISNPNSPSAVATVATTGADPLGVYVQGRYAYVTQRAGNLLEIFDVSNPLAPVSVSTESITGAVGVYVQGRYAYVTSYTGHTLQIVDISNPTNPSVVGSGVSTNNAPVSVKVQGRYAYVTNYTGNSLQVIDIYNPSSPTVVGTVSTGGAPAEVQIMGKTAYVVSRTAAYVQAIDISNPASPTSIGTVSSSGIVPRTIKVQGRYAYVTSVDLTSITQVETFDLGGSYIQQLQAGGLEINTLSASGDVAFGNNVDIQGGLTVGGAAQFNSSVGFGGDIVQGSAVTTGTAFQLTANSLTSGNGLAVSSTNTATTGNLLSVASASTGAFANGGVRFNFTGAHTGNGVQIDDVTTTGTVMKINANSLTSGNGLAIASTATGLTGNLFSVTSASTGAFSNGGIRYNFTGAHTGVGVKIDDATTTGTVYQINASALTTGTAFEITGPAAAKLLRVKNDNTQGFNQAQLIVGEGEANNPDSLARDQLYVFGRINTSWNQIWTDCLTSEGTKNAATTATGVYGAAYSGSATTGRLAQAVTSGVSGVCRFSQATPAANATTYFGSGGASTTERSLNPVFEARVMSDNNTDHRNLIGFTDMAASTAITADTNNSANEAFFRKTAAGTSWETVTRTASGTEQVNTNVGTTNAWHRMRIEMDNGNAAVRFYVDGTLVATHTTAAPTAAMGFTVANNVTSTTSRNLDVDYMRVWSDDPPASIAPGGITGDEGLDTTAVAPETNEPAAEDNSNDALLTRIQDLETDVADLKQYKDVLTTEMLGDASSKKAVFIADVEFRNQVEFSADALFKANVNVDGTLNANGRVVVSNNTGTVTVQPGQTEVQVLFVKPLAGKPNVFVSTENPDVRVVAQTRTANGFIIKLSEPITEPLDVQWFAVEKE